jgi:hypothetical protein
VIGHNKPMRRDPINVTSNFLRCMDTVTCYPVIDVIRSVVTLLAVCCARRVLCHILGTPSDWCVDFRLPSNSSKIQGHTRLRDDPQTVFARETSGCTGNSRAWNDLWRPKRGCSDTPAIASHGMTSGANLWLDLSSGNPSETRSRESNGYSMIMAHFQFDVTIFDPKMF